MKAVTVKQLRQELSHYSQKELIDICLRLSRFKKENKELLTYLLFEAENEQAYIETVKEEIDKQFTDVNTKSYYLIKKGIRKVLTNIRKYARYSPHKSTEVELLLYFCKKTKAFRPSYKRSVRLVNLYNTQIEGLQKKISLLHEDLQYDYGLELNELTD